MENWTLGAISLGLVFVVTLITNIKKLKNEINEVMSKALEPTNNKIDNLETSLTATINKSDLNATKNFLVARIAEFKAGEKVDDITKERFWEQYEHYKTLGGNSYISNEVEKLKRENKI